MEIYVEMLSLHFKHLWKYFKITKLGAHENASLFLFSFNKLNIYTIDSPPPLETLHIPSGFLSLPNWALQHYSFS